MEFNDRRNRVRDIRDVSQEMGGRGVIGHQEETYPERYGLNRGFGKHLRAGFTETRSGTTPDQKRIHFEVKAHKWDDLEGTPEEKMAMHTPFGMGNIGEDGQTLLNVKVPGSERLAPLFRTISEEDWQRAKQNGYLKSDQRMNLSTEGTVAADRDTGSFYAQPGANRLIRIQQRPGVDWRVDKIDDYVKTHDPIPLEHIDAVSPVLYHNPKTGDFRPSARSR